MRPASSSSITAIRTLATSSSAARASSSSVTGEGPSRLATRSTVACDAEIEIHAGLLVELIGHPRLRRRGGVDAEHDCSPHSGLLGVVRIFAEIGERVLLARLVEQRDRILDARANPGAVTQQIVGAFRAGIERRTGNRHHLPALLAREARGDQRARAARRLDDDHAERQARHDPVATRKVAPARLPFERHFRDHRAEFGDARNHADRLGRIGLRWPPASTPIVPVGRLAR